MNVKAVAVLLVLAYLFGAGSAYFVLHHKITIVGPRASMHSFPNMTTDVPSTVLPTTSLPATS